MSLRSKQYIIPLKPIAWVRAGVNHAKRHFYDPQTREKYHYGIYLTNQHGNEQPFSGPLWLNIDFHMPIPKTIAKRKHHGWHDTIPDLDNLEKFLQDAITSTGVIWSDDRLIAKKTTQKTYHITPELIITITELT